MADLDYTIGVNTNQAERNVDRLKKSIGGLGITFGDLRKAVGGIAIGSLISNTIRWADSIQDVSDATDIATANILGFSQAVSESGGTAQDANNAVLRLSETIGNAKEGNKSAIESFAKVGVTLEDLQNLSNEDIFRKVISGLGSISDASRRSAAIVELLGKAMRGVQLDQVNARMDLYVESNQSVAGAVKSTADAQERLGQIFQIFQKALLEVLKPISDIIASINTSSESFKRFTAALIAAGKAILYLAAAFVAFSAIGRILRAIYALGVGLVIGTQRVYEFFKALKNGEKIAKTIIDAFKGLNFGNKIKVFFDLFNVPIDWLIKNWKFVTIGIVSISAAFKEFFAIKPPEWLSNFLDSPITKIKEFLGLNKSLREIAEQEAASKMYDQGGPQGQRRLSQGDRGALMVERLKRENEEREIAIRNEKQQIKLGAERLQDSKAFYNQLLGDKAIEAGQLEMDKDRTKEQKRLRDLFDDIALINETIASETGIKQLAKQNELIGLYGDEYQLKAGLLDIENERENQINNIFASLRSLGEEVTSEDAERARRQIELAQYVADEKTKIFLDGLAKQRAAEENVPGTLNRFFDDLARSASPAIVALKKADSVLNNMRTSLDEFATTGKFKFKNFALAVIRDLLMIEAQTQLTLLFSSIGKAFTAALFPAAIPIPGKAMGGPVTGNSPYVVGEKGPELFIPKSSGTIIPNDKMSGNQSSGGPVTNVYNNYSISAIDSQSVAQFFAQNRKMALGAVTMAQKELSYGS